MSSDLNKEQLRQWAESALRDVEESGACVRRIELVSSVDGQVWHTWIYPSPEWKDVDAWCSDAERRVRALADGWPARQVQITFVGKTADGDVLSQHPCMVRGTKSVGALDPTQALHAAAMDSTATMIEKLQRLSMTQLDAATRQTELQNETIFQQTLLIKIMRERDLMTTGTQQASAVEEMLAANLPDILKLASEFFSKTKYGEAASPKPNGKGTHTS